MEFSAKLIQILKSARHITVLTGAGVSKESGIPTFREAQTGLWAQYDSMELATPQAFQRNPKLVWEWYEWRRGLVREKKPNAGHYALLEMEKHVPAFNLITQNVDGYHGQVGNQNIIELHGNIMRTKRWSDDEIITEWKDTGEVPPRCSETGSLLRPDVVWFGENMPLGAIEAAIQGAQNSDVFFSIGTSALVQPAASLPLYAARTGAVLVEINPAETPLTEQMDYVISGMSGDVLPKLVKTVWRT